MGWHHDELTQGTKLRSFLECSKHQLTICIGGIRRVARNDASAEIEAWATISYHAEGLSQPSRFNDLVVHRVDCSADDFDEDSIFGQLGFVWSGGGLFQDYVHTLAGVVLPRFHRGSHGVMFLGLTGGVGAGSVVVVAIDMQIVWIVWTLYQGGRG